MRKTVWWKFRDEKGNVQEHNEVMIPLTLFIAWIGIDFYNLFYDKNGKLKYSIDVVIATAREVGKTYVAVAIIIYEIINDPNSNFVLTRKYAGAAGAFYEMFNKVINEFVERYEVEYKIYWEEVKEYTTKPKKKGVKPVKKEKTKIVKEIITLKGKGTKALFSYGKDGQDKNAIFYNYNYDQTLNQIIFLRGADDPDGSRGLSCNVGYIKAVLLEEYSQEVDKGKLDPEEQITRYNSLFSSSSRYSKKFSLKPNFPQDLKVVQWALANIWDPKHPYNVALLEAIPEEEWRSFVEENPEENYFIERTYKGIKYIRATPAFNLFLYPKGSEQRKNLIDRMNAIINSEDDYKKAEVLGYTFPGFLKDGNPVADVIEALIEMPAMTEKELQEEFEVLNIQYGADPGLRDDAATIMSGDIKNHATGETGTYIGDFLFIDNKERRRLKKKRIPSPVQKDLFLKFWTEDILKWYNDDEEEAFIYVNLDMRALSIKDDFNDELFPKNKVRGYCKPFPSDERRGFGLEQRKDIVLRVFKNTIIHPKTKAWLILMLKSLEPYQEGKVQPHPRKGAVDVWDTLCYSIVERERN